MQEDLYLWRINIWIGCKCLTLIVLCEKRLTKAGLGAGKMTYLWTGQAYLCHSREANKGGSVLGRVIIEGGRPLRGTIRASGAKNSCLALMAACLLASEECILHNVPVILDVTVLANILEELGMDVRRREDGELHISPQGSLRTCAPHDLVRRIRASNLLIGPLLAKMGRAEVALSGGCNIGSRPVDLHLKGLRALGADIDVSHGRIEGRAKRLKGTTIYLDFPSVGATENIMMAATLAQGLTVIENAAREPEIVDLASFLNLMGAKIKGAGTSKIRIEGVDELGGVEYHAMPDRIEVGTFMVAGAITGGNILINNVIPTHIEPLIAKFKETGIPIKVGEDFIQVDGSTRYKAVDVRTLPYPGFATDMQPLMVSLLSLAEGTSMVTETIFPNRFGYVDELKRMGASIKVDERSAFIDGVESLAGAPVTATDLRGGAALVLAALAAQGISEIEGMEHVERGYENIEEKLHGIGARITREHDFEQKRASSGIEPVGKIRRVL
jgi:UDP-N-acetylglucosamine 1-carboxyvinyltransferase